MYYDYGKWEYVDVNDLVGKVLTKIDYNNGDQLIFETLDGEQYMMFHRDDCCESVYVESIVGDLNDLVGHEILLSEEVSSEGHGALGEYDESYTWTFYKFATIKGYVDIRWYGSSNGYYSESVDFVRKVK